MFVDDTNPFVSHSGINVLFENMNPFNAHGLNLKVIGKGTLMQALKSPYMFVFA